MINPKIAEAIGHLNVAWSAVELRLFTIFELLTGFRSPLGRAIFFSQRTTRARLDLVLAVAPIVLRKRRGDGTSRDLKRLRRVLGQIGNVAGIRNAYIHDPWAGYDRDKTAYQLRLSGQEVHGEYERIYRAKIARFTSTLQSKADQLWHLYLALEPKMPALLERLSQRRTPDLVPATIDIHQKKKKAKPRRPPRS
jgi:hypothetical protein